METEDPSLLVPTWLLSANPRTPEICSVPLTSGSVTPHTPLPSPKAALRPLLSAPALQAACFLSAAGAHRESKGASCRVPEKRRRELDALQKLMLSDFSTSRFP